MLSIASEEKRKNSTIKVRMILITITVVVSILYALLGIAHLRQQREQGAITAELTQLLPVLAQTKPGDIEQRLAAAQAKLANEQASFPSELSSAEILDRVLEVAHETQVKTLPLRGKPISLEKVRGQAYKVLRLEIKADGSFDQLRSFISRLESETFKTLILEKVSVSMTAEMATATLNLAIYAQSRATEP